jgi:SAM-dependent methyltransferase
MTSDDPVGLRNAAVATRFYDERFRHGYMEGWTREKCDRVASLLKALPLPARGRALDFGCGVGMFTEVLSDALPGWEIEGTDLSSVAVDAAALRLPQCRFFPLAECSHREGQYDLVFTHHVLEHVSDLDLTARLLSCISKPAASLVHILPCGNPGSLEHTVCLLRTDGIRHEPERVFFFEEEGHLRRLDTDGIVALWSRDGYRLERDWYAAQSAGAIYTRTALGLEEVLAFADPEKGVDQRARRKLRSLRAGLVVLWALRRPVTVVHNKRKYGCHSVRDYILLAGGLALYPFSRLVDWGAGYFAAREWKTRRSDRQASEMYIHLVRP